MSIQNNNAMTVDEVMMSLDKVPVIRETVIFKEALEKMCQTHLGIACIIDDNFKLLGILTDGDIRRGTISGLNQADSVSLPLAIVELAPFAAGLLKRP